MSSNRYKFVESTITLAFVVTFMYDSYSTLTQRCAKAQRYLVGVDNPKNEEVAGASKRERMEKLVYLSRRLYMIVTITHTYLAIKYLLLGLLNLDWFAEYRYYDCYILGRPSFSGTSYVSTIVMALIINFCLLGYRYLVRRRIRYTFDFELFKFLQLDPDVVLENEIAIEEDRLIRRRRSSIAVPSDKSEFRDKYSILDKMGKEYPSRYETQYEQIKLHFENPFQPHPDQPDSILIRLNRTSKAHNNLVFLMFTMYTIGFVVCTIVLLCLVIFITSETMLTAHGFFINYEVCIRYIKDLSPKQSSEYSYIYDLHNADPPSRRIPSLPRFNFYHVIRLSIDLLENAVMYFDPFISSTLHTSYLILQVLDLITYSQTLEQKLVETIRTMRNENEARLIMSFCLDAVSSQSLTDLNAIRDHSKRETKHCITTLQAYILDYIRLVRSYQDYSSHQASSILLLWILLTAGISLWLATNTFNDLEYEFRYAQMGLGIFAVICMSFMGIFESKSRRLYYFMSIAMSIDKDVLVSKQKWCKLSKFFYPRPMYCFALFGQSEMSWLFGMKVSSHNQGSLVSWLSTNNL